MRQVTQCPACSTQFRVVEDQLKISEGWVRCGRCGEVFDARQAMVAAVVLSPASEATDGVEAAEVVAAIQAADMAETAEAGFADPPAPSPVADQPVAMPLATTASGAEIAPVPVNQAPIPEATATTSDAPSAEAVATQATTSGASLLDAALSEASPPDAGHSKGVPPFSALPDAVDIVVDGGDVYASAALAAVPAVAPAAAPPDAAAPPEVSFVRAARRQAFWDQLWVRWALAGMLLSLGVGLLGQVLWHERNRVAAAAPSLRPWLEVACQPLGCQIEHWQQIESVRLDGTALVRTGGGAYRLEVGLYNTANWPVATPALELSLTNARDDVVLRRVILAGDWSSPVAELPPQGGVALSVLLSVADTETLRTSGYRALVFYP